MPVIEKRLAELSLTLPAVAAPVAAYMPFVTVGNIVYISGQLPREDGTIKITGLVGKDIDIAAAQKAARLCALNAIAVLKDACGGDLDRVARCVKLGGFVASAAGFYDQPKVINGASELVQEIWGEAGRHSRFAVGVSALPLNAAVEVEAIFALR